MEKCFECKGMPRFVQKRSYIDCSFHRFVKTLDINEYINDLKDEFRGIFHYFLNEFDISYKLLTLFVCFRDYR